MNEEELKIINNLCKNKTIIEIKEIPGDKYMIILGNRSMEKKNEN